MRGKYKLGELTNHQHSSLDAQNVITLSGNTPKTLNLLLLGKTYNSQFEVFD